MPATKPQRKRYRICMHCGVFIHKYHGYWIHDNGEDTYTDCRLVFKATPEPKEKSRAKS